MCDAFTAVLFLKHTELDTGSSDDEIKKNISEKDFFLGKLQNIVLSNILMKLRQKEMICFLFSCVYVKQKSLRSVRPAKKRPMKGR